VKCCYEEECKHCSGEQCQRCKQDKCCSGDFSWVAECQAPTAAPTPDCDLSACDGCSGSQCTSCRENEKVKCCYEEECKHCSGEQCQRCKQDKCCSGDFSWVAECQTPTQKPPAPTCTTGDSVQCPGSDAYCAGNQCCPGIPQSNSLPFPCPSADVDFVGCPSQAKVEDCVTR